MTGSVAPLLSPEQQENYKVGEIVYQDIKNDFFGITGLSNDLSSHLDFYAIGAAIRSCFWYQEKSSVYLLNTREDLVNFKEKDASKFITKTFGSPKKLSFKNAVENIVDQLGLEPKDRKAMIKDCLALPELKILDYLKYNNQRDSMEIRVDMFASKSKVEILEDKARVIFSHKKLEPKVSKIDSSVISDYKEHFPELDEFLSFIVASRFATDRKQAYLWIKAGSDWGKGFLQSVFEGLGLVAALSVKEVESFFEGKPVGRSMFDFKRAWILWIDEFKSMKSEIKQLQSEISITSKYKMATRVEVFAKLFTSAEAVSSLAGENGVEDQFANRISMYKYDSNIEKRDKFINDKNYYLSHVLSYVANFINTAVKLKVSLGRNEAGDQANKELKAFINKNCIDNFYDRFSDSLPSICARINDYAINNYKNYLSNGACNPNDAALVEFDKETKDYFLRDATVFIDNFINKSFDRAEYVSLSIKKPLIREMMSSDGKGSARHYINGVRARAVKLKIFKKDLENKANNQ